MGELLLDRDLMRKIREQKNIGMAELARMTGLSYSAIQKYETRRQDPSFKTLNKIANALGVNPVIFIRGAIPTESLCDKVNGDRPKLVIGDNEWIVPDDLIETVIKLITTYQQDVK